MAYAFNPNGRRRSPNAASPVSPVSPVSPINKLPQLTLDLDALKMRSEEIKNISVSPQEGDLPIGTRWQDSPSSPVRITMASQDIQEPWTAQIEDESNAQDVGHLGRLKTGGLERPGMVGRQSSIRAVPLNDQSPVLPHVEGNDTFYQGWSQNSTERIDSPHKSSNRLLDALPPRTSSRASTPKIQLEHTTVDNVQAQAAPLQYHHDRIENGVNPRNSQGTIGTMHSSSSDGQTASSGGEGHSDNRLSEERLPRRPLTRPASSNALGADLNGRGRSLTPHGMRNGTPSPRPWTRNLSANQSPDARPTSYIDLLNIPYSQQVAQQTIALDNARLRGAVGVNASLLDTSKTLEMYRANVKKTNDPAVQYEFAIFMVNAAQEAAATTATNGHLDGTSDSGRTTPAGSLNPQELLKESRQILQKLAETKSYPFAQYYLADGYASGLFNKGKDDYDRAFPLFVAAGKHGHAEAGYRAALCFEFGWGCRRDYAKAVQFYRQSASKGHPGAATRLGKACLTGDMGLAGKYKEGIKWLKRANESADRQHNSAPYELGLMHTTGFGDDVFKDESYAAQLFTRAAELGNPEASLKMGEAYEHGLLTCPRDPALSLHFYTGAAQAGLPQAMMALCAWYMVGAEPILEKDEPEAYEWAKRAAETGYSKAEYAVGYFTEMGIGCRRDALESNVWYVRAASQGDERAKQRLAIIRAAEAGDLQMLAPSPQPQGRLGKKKSMLKGDDKDCIIM